MPQGITGAPATFQRLMERAIGDMNMIQVLVYLDDLIVFGKHWRSMKNVSSKCWLYQSGEIKFNLNIKGIDSGDAVNLIDSKLVRTLCLPTIPCTPPLRITSIDSQPIGGGYLTHQTELLNLQLGLFRQERLAFYITTSPANPLVLGYPWLRCHDPLISWSKRELLRWSPQCTESCFNGIIPRPCLTTTVECLENTVQVTIPWEYNDFREVFSKERATDLPAHHPWDCAIDLNHDAMPPKCHIYLLSIPERKAMEEYNGEVFAMGYIQPSTSPAVGFFFMGKKDDGLCPCIDYGGLNAITVWYPYPLPLVPASLEQLRGGVIFTKLDLRSAYNLIRTSGKLLFTQPVDTMSTCKLHPSAFYSRRLTPAERNYDVGNRELLSIKADLEEWHHWLEGAHIPFSSSLAIATLSTFTTPNALMHARLGGLCSSHASTSLFRIVLVPRIEKRMPCQGNTRLKALSQPLNLSCPSPLSWVPCSGS
ncbi:hypothetical protein QTP86_025255 [Hemibagrus guttatus]|nr:hypothetical protein QTP86_025255 [Hemibagrus guttatus]